MTLIKIRRALIGALILLLARQGVAQRAADLTAILTQIEGQVTLSLAGRTEIGSVRRATQRQVIRRGEIVHVPNGAQATLICSTEKLVSLTGPRDWVLGAEACGQGLSLPETSYRNLTVYAGRILPRNGALLLELESRNVDVGLAPILLSPRNTAVMESYPRLVWTQAPEAVEYEIKVRGPVGTSIQLTAADIQCGHGSGPWHDLEVCSWAPSSKWPELEPEKPVFLEFGSQQALTSPLRQVRVRYEIHLLSTDDQRRVREDLRRIATLPVDTASRLLLTAGAYVEIGLYADAIAAYDAALRAQEMPEARVTLGDLYLMVDLTALAEREYRQVLASAPVPSAQAAAELGLGQAAYFRKSFDDARAHFKRACDLYTKLGLSIEAEDARASAAQAQR